MVNRDVNFSTLSPSTPCMDVHQEASHFQFGDAVIGSRGWESFAGISDQARKAVLDLPKCTAGMCPAGV